MATNQSSLTDADLATLEADWIEGNFDNADDAVRNAQRNIPRLIAEVRKLRRVPKVCPKCGPFVWLAALEEPEKAE